MGYNRLWKHDLTIQRAFSGSDSRLVPVATATIEVYKQGVTVSADVTLTGGSGTISVHDTNGIREGDLVQIGVVAGSFQVDAVGLNQLTVSGYANPTDVNTGDRLVVVNPRPSVYTDQAGLLQYLVANQGRAPSTGASTGATSFFTNAPVVDVIVSSPELAADQLLTDLSGQMQNRTFSIEAFGGYESALKTGTGDNNNFDNGDELSDALITLNNLGGGTLEFGPGTYYFSTEVAFAGVSNIKIKGAGIKRTTLYLNTGTGYLFDIQGTCNDIVFEDLTIKRASGTDPHVLINEFADRTIFRRVRIDGIGAGFLDLGTDTELVDILFTGAITKGIAITKGSGQRITRPRFRCSSGNLGTNALVTIGDSGNLPVDIYIEDLVNSWENPTDVGTVVLLQTDFRRVTFMGGSFTGGNSGAGKDAVVITGGKAAKFIAPHIFSSARGIVITGGTGHQFICPSVTGCLTQGIQVTGGQHIDLITPLVSDNNTSSAVAINHIDIDGDVNCRVIGPRTGNLVIGPGTGGTLPWGVKIADGSTTGCMVALAAGIAGTSGLWTVDKEGSGDTKFLTVGLNQSPTTATGLSSGFGALRKRHFISDETSLDVEGVNYVTTDYANNIIVTALTNGIQGQLLFITNEATLNTLTIQGGAGIFTTGTSVVLAGQDTVIFFKDAEAWKQITTVENS